MQLGIVEREPVGDRQTLTKHCIELPITINSKDRLARFPALCKLGLVLGLASTINDLQRITDLPLPTGLTHRHFSFRALDATRSSLTEETLPSYLSKKPLH